MNAYSSDVVIPNMDTPGWQHSVDAATRSALTSVATPNVGVLAISSGSTCSNVDLYGIKRIVLPQKEYKEELEEEKAQ